MENDTEKKMEDLAQVAEAGSLPRIVRRCPFCGAAIAYDGVNFMRYECGSTRDKPINENYIQRSVQCTRDSDASARLLLVRWTDWARAHGHDIGIADDTRSFLAGYFALQSESSPNV